MSLDLKEGVDFTYEADGVMVLTADYLRRRGHCCGSQCRNCPYTKPCRVGNTELEERFQTNEQESKT